MDKSSSGAQPRPKRARCPTATRNILWFTSLAFLYHCLVLFRAEGSNWTITRIPELDLWSTILSIMPWSMPWSQRALSAAPYGNFPMPNDPFRFLPCTNLTVPPALDNSDAEKAWRELYDPDPAHWSWGYTSPPTANGTNTTTVPTNGDPFAGRGIFMCGYLDVPLDYTNASDKRIARLAVTKFQVSGLARVTVNTTAPTPTYSNSSVPVPGRKSNRTIVINPGGPGGSGTAYAWRGGIEVTKRFSNGVLDVLGWDPRGVNASLPAISCYPYDADRDRWQQLSGQYREVAIGNPDSQLEVVDAMNNATFRACFERHGDLARFVSTSFVARDLEEIRKALGEDELTGYLVSYGTGIGQTYASMFPDSVGRVILDGTEYVRDHRELGGFGWTALDNATDAWEDGFLGECLNAGPANCALAKSRDGKPVTLPTLDDRMQKLIKSLAVRPMVGYTNASGPSIITYSALVGSLYGVLYNARSWPAFAQMLYELEGGNTTLASAFLEGQAWEYDPTLPCKPLAKPSPDELGNLVICADSYDAPLPWGPEGKWWRSLWQNMTEKAWISGNSRFLSVLPCRHFNTYWPKPAEVFRGGLNQTLKHPVLLIAETYDPATPLRNGRRLLNEMGRNARLVVHHGYGHSSRDTSNCTEAIARAYIMDGMLPEKAETNCFADEKPYLYGIKPNATNGTIPAPTKASPTTDPVKLWKEHIKELAMWNPRLAPAS